MTTKAVEVCVNGVKQVIIVPLAPSSDDVTTVSSTAFLPGSLSALSSVTLDNRPDDVKLLAESCVPVTSSSVSSFSSAAVLSAATNVHTRASTAFTNHVVQPPPYQLFSASRMPVASSQAEVSQNSYAAAYQRFYVNSVDNTATLPSKVIPRFTPPLPAVPSLSAPVLNPYGFLPAQQSGSAVPVPTVPPQPFRFSTDTNTVLPSQVQPGLNHLQHLLPSTLSQAQWRSYDPLQVRPMYERALRALAHSDMLHSNPVLSNYLQPSPTITAQSLSNPGSDNYRHFLPSLQRAIDPNLQVNQPPVQFQDYLSRKRGVFPQSSAQRSRVDVGNYHVQRFDPRLYASRSMTFQRPPLVNANQIQTSCPSSSRVVISSSLSHSNLNSNTTMRRKTVRKQRTDHGSHRDSVNYCCAHPLSQPAVSLKSANLFHEPLRLLNSGTSHHVTSAAYQITGSNAGLTIPTQSEWPQNSTDALRCRTAAGAVADLQVTTNLTWSTSLPVTTFATMPIRTVASCVMKTTNLSALSEYNNNASCCQPVTSVPTDLQVTVANTQPSSVPVVAIASSASSVADVTTHATHTTCHATAVMQRSAATASDSTDLILDSILFEVGSTIAATSVPGNCSYSETKMAAANPRLSNVSSTDLLQPNSDSIADLSHTVTASDAVQQSGTDLEIGTSQLDASLNDLGSLPEDVMVETAESESLLMSFCNLFDQPNAAHQNLAEASFPVTSGSVKDSCENGEQQQSDRVSVQHQSAERGLQFAKSLGKGQHFVEEMRQRRQEQASRKRRKTRLTSLEVADESNSSGSWKPDSYSESSDYQTPSSPSCSTVSSVSRSSDDFAVITTRAKRRRTMYGKRKQKQSSRHTVCSAQKYEQGEVHNSPVAVTQKCSVMLERLQLQGQYSVNVHNMDSLLCCHRHRSVKRVQRIVSSDSECSTAGQQPIQKLRIKIKHIEDTDSS